MALDNVTLFEVHLGDRSDDQREQSDAKSKSSQSKGKQSQSGSDEQSEESGGGVPVKGLLALAVVVAGAGFAVKRFLGGGETEIETEPVEPGVEVERSEV